MSYADRGLAVSRAASWCDVHVQANVSLKAAWVWIAAPRRRSISITTSTSATTGRSGPSIASRRRSPGPRPASPTAAYTAERTGAEHMILNAYDDATFGPPPDWAEKDRDLVFLGRLVSRRVRYADRCARAARGSGRRPGLTVIGDGPDRGASSGEQRRRAWPDQVRFAGGLKGAALAAKLARHRVMVVPSRYEEPFGIVALEGLACGCMPIVSERGGLTDAIGGHGLTFPNGDAGGAGGAAGNGARDMEAPRRDSTASSNISRVAALAPWPKRAISKSSSPSGATRIDLDRRIAPSRPLRAVHYLYRRDRDSTTVSDAFRVAPIRSASA